MRSFEIEQKYRCKNLAPFRKKLIQVKARLMNQGLELNELWDTVKFFRGRKLWRLQSKKSVLRLRRHGKTVELTFKGPRLKSKYSKRVEIQTPVEYAPMRTILETLGFQIAKQYSKKREVYEWGKLLVTLDFLRGLGNFIELEGSVKDIAHASKQLGLSEQDREERSYLAMLFEKEAK